ncbi:response regulator [Coraliomargarita sp. SDUM461003]|uniref:Response regulator n=1 Tax=Thalassobacterium maritimum TaxID=3041265 RepID=A0ABU1AVA1_9BACT|nr:response regulator [Coraliomargarita sp. SDUM461003]MDQ8206917.1 response regulator [Coraliomargarita sp. SDUM461003]
MHKTKRTILLVDDSVPNVDLLLDLLDGLGHRVLVAENGESVLQRCRLAKPDVIFMNTILPGIDGVECCRRIKAEAEFRQIPVVIMSDDSDDGELRSRCFKSGACAFITKPVIRDEVVAILNNQLELIELREQVKTSNGAEARSLEEFDLLVDFIAHDMKSPIVCITGFAEELAEQFSEVEVDAEWHEFLGYIHHSANDVDIILEALVLLKNLRTLEWREPELVKLESLFQGVLSRYEQFESYKPLEMNASCNDYSVISQPTLLEELVFILIRNFGNLIEPGETLQLNVEIESSNNGQILLRLNANTRAMTDVELSHILEPLQGKKRKRVKDVSIQMLCAQKIISYLAINAWAEHGPKDSLTVCLNLENGG